ncbi:hypothetical protein AMTR_s00025p00068280 [Amborella trichopoda]|uniref:Uncharacterized protein n=1 Tax=Amborella trichopoda TaxID=13333 RepID=W1PW45_AMBTC|nr:hypothetical protein AMTR_s00025p00068280 [Amborella trichopoda]
MLAWNLSSHSSGYTSTACAVRAPPSPISILNMGPAKHPATAMAGWPALATATSATRSPTEFPQARTELTSSKRDPKDAHEKGDENCSFWSVLGGFGENGIVGKGEREGLEENKRPQGEGEDDGVAKGDQRVACVEKDEGTEGNVGRGVEPTPFRGLARGDSETKEGGDWDLPQVRDLIENKEKQDQRGSP